MVTSGKGKARILLSRDGESLSWLENEEKGMAVSQMTPMTWNETVQTTMTAMTAMVKIQEKLETKRMRKRWWELACKRPMPQYTL